MYLCKRPIYNNNLSCAALEVNAAEEELHAPESGEKLSTLLKTNTENVPVFLPYELCESINQSEINFPMILKLHASKLDKEKGLEELSDQSKAIALLMDDVDQLAWINSVDYIGIDGKLLACHSMKKVVEFIQSHQHKVIAYGIDDLARFNQCKNMNMDYYCGDFLYQPNFDDEEQIAANKLNLMNLVSTLQEDEVSLTDITDIINNDPALSYQLLKVANSSAFSGVNKIESIQQAIVRLGFANLKNIVMLLSMKSVSDKPKELLESGLIRAYMCQNIIAKSCEEDQDKCYTMGLLSILDTLLDCPMEKLISGINLCDDVQTALLNRDGKFGQLLSAVIHYEEGAWDKLDDTKINGIDICQTYLYSADKAAQAFHAMTKS